MAESVGAPFDATVRNRLQYFGNFVGLHTVFDLPSYGGLVTS